MKAKSNLREVMRDFARETKFEEHKVVNFTSGAFCVEAAKATPKAIAKKIEAYLSANNCRMAAIILSKAGAFRGKNREQRKELVAKFIKKAKQSTGYIAAGWIKAGQEFGVLRGRRVSKKSEHRGSFGEKAKPMPISTAITMARMGNNAVGAEQIAGPIVDAALAAAGDRQAAKLARILAAIARKYSAR